MLVPFHPFTLVVSLLAILIASGLQVTANNTGSDKDKPQQNTPALVAQQRATNQPPFDPDAYLAANSKQPSASQVLSRLRLQNVDSSDSPVNFVLLIPSEEKKAIKVSRGKAFFLPHPVPHNTTASAKNPDPYAAFSTQIDEYELLDAKFTGAVVRNPITGEHIFIPSLGASEHISSVTAFGDPIEGSGSIVDEDEAAKIKAGNALSVQNAHGQVYAWSYMQNGQAYQGNAIGAFTVGTDYEWGMGGLSKDTKEAVRWYWRAANEGDCQAQNCLGDIFEHGGFTHVQGGFQSFDNSVVKDETLAFYWYHLAFEQRHKVAEQGDGSVMYNLAVMYAEGHGVPKNGREAVKWYRRAFEQDGLPSMSANALALIYENGDCVLKDEIEALAWAYLAQGSGNSFLANTFEDKLGSQAALIAQQRSKELQAEMAKEKEQTAQRRDDSEASTQPKAYGSGVFVSAKGLFLTAAHVIQGAHRVEVVTDQKKMDAQIVQIDAANDIALLRCTGTFSPVAVAPSGSIKLGQTVFTLGFPNIDVQGFSPKMTEGEISSMSGMEDDPRQWQISVPVQPGNSGGPLFDEEGNLIGLIEAKLNAVGMAKMTGDVPQNVNYAVKSAYLMPLLDPFSAELLPQAGKPAVPQKLPDVVARSTFSIGLVIVY